MVILAIIESMRLVNIGKVKVENRVARVSTLSHEIPLPAACPLIISPLEKCLYHISIKCNAEFHVLFCCLS